MKWRREPGAFRAPPYSVRLQGPTWMARCSRAALPPVHLGSFETAQEALAVCEEHAQQVREKLGNSAPSDGA